MNPNLTAELPLTLFFDGACRLCATEMAHLRTADDGSHLRFVDCAAQDFDELSWRAEGVSREQMLAAMHVRDAGGRWFTGPDAFEVIYRSVGLPGLASAWTHPLLRPANERLYAWVVRHRQALSRLQAHRVIDLFWRWLAARLAQRKAGAPACPACRAASERP